MKNRRIVFLCIIILWGAAVLAAQGTAVPPAANPGLPLPGQSVGSMAFKMTAALAFVIVLIYLVVYLYKRVLAPREMQVGSGGAQRAVRILGQVYLGPRKSLCLVEMADRVLVIGVSQQNLNLITEITDLATIEVLRNEYSGEGLHHQFSQYLKKFLSSHKESKGAHV